MDKKIKVTGKGKLSVKPDRIRLIMDLNDTKESYDETLKQSNEQVNLLKDCFESLGFDRTDLKTISFLVDTKYESYQDLDRTWKQRLLGYEYTHQLKIEFDIDNVLLGKVVYALAHCGAKPKFHIVYIIKDVETAKNQLLANAVEDAKVKSELLAKAANVTLGEIINIDYSWEEIDFISEPMRRSIEPCMMLAENDSESYEMDIEADDIDVTDTVTVVWNIS